MIELTSTAFLCGVVALPVVGMLPADTTTEKLAVGSAQVVLAVVVVCLGLALIHIFKMYRTDLREEHQKLQECMDKQNQKMEKLLLQNAVAFENNSAAQKDLSASVKRLGEIIQERVT